MKYSKLIIITIVLLSLQRLYCDISIDSSGLNEGVNETIDKAEEFLEEESIRLAEEARQYALDHPTPVNSISDESHTSDTSNSDSSSNDSTSTESSSVQGGVKRVYVGSRSGGYAHYVVNCNNGNSYSDLTQKSNGYWHKGIFLSNMGDDYKGLSINELAEKLCK